MFTIMYYGGIALGFAGLAASIAVFIRLDIYHAFMQISGLEAKLALKKLKEQSSAKGQEKRHTQDKEIREYTEKIRTASIVSKEEKKEDVTRELTEQEQSIQSLQETVLLEEEEAGAWIIDEEYMDIHTEESVWNKEE